MYGLVSSYCLIGKHSGCLLGAATVLLVYGGEGEGDFFIVCFEKRNEKIELRIVS